MPEYSSAHSAFLQTCSNRGSLLLADALKYFKLHWQAEFESEANEEDMREAITKINDKINKFDQKIAIMNSEIDRDVYVVFLNTSTAAVMKVQTEYNEVEIKFFRLLLEEIAKCDEHFLKEIFALNLTNRLNEKLTKNRAEELIEIWMNHGYFQKENGNIHMGPKTVGEFGEYLGKHYNDTVLMCLLCKIPIFAGIQCDGEDCSKIFHKDCLRKYLARSSKCPNCKKLWSVPLS